MSHQHQHEHEHHHHGAMKGKSAGKILLAFVLNLGFSVYEFIGGMLTGSTAIMSDSVHDFGDALSIGVSYFLEKKSMKRPNNDYTYGYLRYSLMGGMITTLTLLFGSCFVIVNAWLRIFNPVEINYDGMIVLAVVGVVVNSIAAYITQRGESLNQKSVNLHMLEDVLGWVVVLIGAIVMRFTDISYLDPILSIVVAAFILWQALKNFWSILEVLLEKTPVGVSVSELERALQKLSGVREVHHLHVWSMDGNHNYATLHVVAQGDHLELKHQIREILAGKDIEHVTIELEEPEEKCGEHDCHGAE